MSLAQRMPEDDLLTDGREVIAANVRALMGRKQVTQSQLGEVLHLSQPVISRRVKGKQPFDTDELLALARFFEVQVTDLLADVRSRCFPALSLVKHPGGQMELAFEDPPELQPVR